MYAGKTLFAQLMDFLPWSTFARLVERYRGDHRVRTFTCAEQYRAMAFAQLTYRESLRDIETCLSAQAAKLYHMGFREPGAGQLRRSTLSDANEARDWRIWAELAQRLIAQARKLYADDDLGLELKNTVYALELDHDRPVPCGVSVGALPHHQGGGEDAHPARSQGLDPELHPHLGRQAARCECARSLAAGARCHLRDGPRLRRFRTAPCAASGRGLLRHASQVEHGCSASLLRPVRPTSRHHL